MWGTGKRRRPSGSADQTERELFRELGAKSARSNKSMPRGSRRRGRFAGLVALVIVFSAAAFAVATAFADNPTGSGYTIGDGIIGDAGTTFFSDPVGSVDELGPKNGNSTKLDVINTATPPMLEFTNVNGGVDLSGMWLDTHVDPATGDVWLYFAFSREAATTGQVAFEFQRSPLPAACDFTNVSPVNDGSLTAAQAALIANCNPWKNRQAGDFMIVWDTQGNSTTLNKRDYSGTAFGNAQTIPTNGYKVAVTADELKGEAAINLTTSGIFPANPTQCLTIANVKANTITGNSDQADFKDTILADTSGVGISNCGQIRVTKDTDPEGGIGTFPYTITRDPASALRFDNSTSVDGTLTADGDSDLVSDIKVGADYRLAEGSLAADWMLQSISCVKDGTTYDVVPGNEKFAVDASTITECEIKNVAKPKLTLRKNVVNNSGGSATPGQWTLTATGTGGFSGAGNSADVTDKLVIAGQQYTLSESGGSAGYASTGIWSCTGGAFVSPDKITLSNGQNVSCTITNDDVPGTLIVKKVVINDNGGIKGAAAFAFDVAGPTASNDVSFEADGQNDLVVSAGTYNVTENADAGYTTTYSADCSNAVIPNGGSKTCTITNNDKPATLIVKKVVINDNGGIKGAAAFAFDVAGPTASNDVSFEADGQNDLVVSAGTYNVTENADAGYTTTYSADCSNAVIPNGGSKTCTITNNDKPATLIVKKVVINDNGGIKGAAAFAFDVAGPTASNDVSFEADGQNDLVVSAGTYNVTENADAGYTTTYSADCSNAVIPNGGSKTCTITNNDKPATLIVKKVVINDNGGIKGAAAFAFDVAGPTASNDVSFEADGQNDLVVSAGTYNVTENADAGYTTTYSADCSNAVIPNGGSKTCTITNDDVAGTIIVKKVVINDEGGTKTAGDFTFKVGSAAPVAFVEDPQNPLKGEKPVSVAAGTYTITEPAVAGYDASYENCSDIVVGNGETKTCTITNNDNIPPTVDVQKTVRVAGSADAFAETATAPETSGTFEYRVVAWNTSKEAVTLTALTDKIGDVETNLDGKGTCSVPQSLEASDGTSGGADTYSCTFELTLTGNAGDAQKDTVKATVKDDENDTASAEDDANVSLTDVASSIEVTKTADPETLDESTVGSAVEYTVVVKNTSAVDKVTVDAAGFVDKVKVNGDPTAGDVATITNLDCNPQDNEDDGLPFTLDPTESITCTFSMSVKGNAGDHVNDLITVTGKDDDGNDVSDSDDATVTITDVPSTITVTKTANPTVVQDSGPVTFTVVVRNDSDVDTVYIQTLTDSIYGNLNGKGTCTLEDAIDEGPEGSRRILPGASYTCSFTATVSKTETDVVTATGVDDDEQPVSDDDDATVTVNRTPPPPYKPSSDIAVTKAATPQVQLPLGGGTAPITYNLVVINNGPDAAANVKVADTAPVNVSFVSATTSAGTCSTTAQALDCTIASLAPGASVAITINATVNATGTKVNMVLVTTTTPETNPNNNSAQARTLVTAPVTPPKPPKPPIVVPAICNTLVATPKVLKATGKKQKINITVKQGKKGVKGVKVKIAGPGIKRTVTTGKKGNVKVTLKPGKPGIIKVVILPKKKVNGKWVKVKACNTQRIGVVGVYEPPVTG